MESSRVLVIEDHVLVREALVRALEQLDMVCQADQAGTASEAMRLVDAGQAYALVLVDLMLPDMSGFSLLSVLAQRYPRTPVVVVSALSDEASVRRALKAGAAGFISKALSSGELIRAIECVLRGELVTPALDQTGQVTPARAGRRRSIESLSAQHGLTTAQTRVMELMLEGRTNREIAELLGLAEGTVKVHCSAILRALGVSNRAQALVVLARQGLRA
ncbi:MAG: response regulator transcription factor [Candidatus Dactylopiibacterium sp.]|nr:response regulator transcription factor [Candidatus Dactylopiibacterium sp.]